MDLQTLNKEEFEKLHPSVQSYLTAGIDTNPYGDKIVSEKNFFNMDLFNNDPYNIDPDLPQRTEKLRENPNYFVEGVKAGTSHALELIGSVPGGLDRFYDWGRSTLGFEPTEDSIFDYAEDYLKDIAHDINPESKNFARPEGFVNKFVYGLGQAMPTIVSYIPFIKATAMAGKGLQTIQGIGMGAKSARATGRFLAAGSALPSGIAITDMIREIDDGKLSDIAISGAYGYGTGKILNIANKLNILPRMAVLGSTGYLSAGWEANNEDRLASAAVWATLGVFGPLAEGKSIKRQLSDVEVQTKQLFGQMEKPTLLKESIEAKRLEIQELNQGIELKPGSQVVINSKGDKATIIAFNKKNVKLGNTTDSYVLRQEGKPDRKDFVMTPKTIKSKNVIKDKTNLDKLEKELNKLESLQTKDIVQPTKNVVAEKMFQNAGIIRQHKEMINSAEKINKIQETNEKLISEGKEPKPITEKMQTEMMSSEQIAQSKKFIKDLELENVGYGKIIWTNNNYNDAIFGLDKRPIEVFKQEMYTKDGTPKHADMKESLVMDFNPFKLEGAETKGTFGKSNLVPAKFINQPIVKYINDRIYSNKQKIDTIVEQIAYDPMFAADSLVAPGRGKADFGNYMLKLNSTAEVIRLAGMRKVKTDGGALTKFTLMRLKDPTKATDIVNKSFRIEIDKLREAKKNKEDYATRVDLNEGLRRSSKKDLTPDEIRRIEELQQTRTEDNAQIIDAEIQNIRGIDPFIPVKQGHFKYEVTDKELRTKYKFDTEMVEVYRSIRGAIDKVVDSYNKRVKETKEDANGYIEKIPNYIPHIFTGDFAIFLKKWQGAKRGYRPVDAPGAENILSARALKDYYVKEYGAKDITNTKFNNRKKLDSLYTVQIVKRERSKLGNEEFDAFSKLFERYELTDEAFLNYQQAIDKARQATGFRKFSLQRQGVNGFLGSRLHAKQMYIKKFLKKFSERDLDTRQAADFETAILSYLKGGITAGERLAFNKELGQTLNQVTVVSDGKGGTRNTTIGKDYPISAQMAQQLKANAFGELQPSKLIEKLSQVGSDYIGNSGLTRILGGANQVTLNAKLLFGNMRFLLSQVFQPYHMIFPRLVDLQYSGFNKGNVAMSQIKAFRDIFFPDKEMKGVIEFMYKEGVVDQKFLNEAAAEVKGLMGTPKLPGKLKDPLGRRVFDFSRLLKILTLQDFAGKAEQVSRLNASLMLYNFFRSAGVQKQSAMEMAAYNANKYMVEYNYLEQPGIYGNRGLGPLGKPFGLFKTFQHNYLAQLADYAGKAAQGKGNAGLIAFFTQMVFSAGIFGVIGFESAERILRVLSPTVQKFTGEPLPSMTETILTSDLPAYLKYGVPSGALNVDLTATLAAPGVNLGDLVSVPALDYLGLNPLNGFAQGRGRGIIPTGYNALITAIASDSSEEKRENYVKFLSAIAPSSMQGAVEQYYMGLPIGYWQYWTPSKEFKDLHKMGKYANIQRDVFKRGRGEVVRGYEDWFARTLSAYSLEEKEALKLVYVTTRVKKNLRDDISGYLTAGAKHLMTDGFVPLYILNRLTKYGLTYPQIFDRLTNRADLMNTTILDRLIKKTNSMQYNKRISALRNSAISHGFDLQYR
jgi:hypothetical protein